MVGRYLRNKDTIKSKYGKGILILNSKMKKAKFLFQ